jgi:bacterioferritin-associated ferredoxin
MNTPTKPSAEERARELMTECNLRSHPDKTLAKLTALIQQADEVEELNRKLEVETASELCTSCNRHWSPSLIESSVCIFCILKSVEKERDTLKRELIESQANLAKLQEVAKELATNLHQCHDETGCKSQCSTSVNLNQYHNLPPSIKGQRKG